MQTEKISTVSLHDKLTNLTYIVCIHLMNSGLTWHPAAQHNYYHNGSK